MTDILYIYVYTYESSVQIFRNGFIQGLFTGDVRNVDVIGSNDVISVTCYIGERPLYAHNNIISITSPLLKPTSSGLKIHTVLYY